MNFVAPAQSLSMSRGIVFLGVCVLHIALLVAIIATRPFRALRETPVSAVMMLDEAPASLRAPNIAPNFEIVEPTIDPPVIDAVPLIDDPESESEAINSAPILATSVPDEIAHVLARRAGLYSGQHVTVVLRIEVLPTGRAGVVTVDRSGGNADIDAAATEYAQGLTWLAGRRNGVTSAIVVRMAVHLAG
jgi:hypothetical protein